MVKKLSQKQPQHPTTNLDTRRLEQVTGGATARTAPKSSITMEDLLIDVRE